LFAGSSNELLSFAEEAELKRWSLSARETRRIAFDGKPLNAPAVSPDGVSALILTEDGAQLLDLAAATFRAVAQVPATSTAATWVPGARGLVLLLVGDHEGGIQQLNLSGGDPGERLDGHAGAVLQIVVDSESGWAASVGEDNTVRFWDLAEGRASGQPVKLPGTASDMVIEDKDTVIAAISGHGLVRCSSDGTATRLAAADSKATNALALYGTQLIGACEDGHARIWDLETGNVLVELAGHRGPVRALSVSEDGKRLVTGSDDKSIKVWDISSGGELLTLIGHQSGVKTVRLASNGADLLSAGVDGELIIWATRAADQQP
jgi:WD40 repeat protein